VVVGFVVVVPPPTSPPPLRLLSGEAAGLHLHHIHISVTILSSKNADTFLRNVGSNKTYMPRQSRRRDGIPHSHRRENLKSYIALTGWAL
jgi:hypothetical protein